jgi:phosphatidylglycerophosphate synthase
MTESSKKQRNGGADRRPIRSREHRVWKAIAHGLAMRGVSANAISVVGMIACIGAGAALAGTARCPEWSRALWIAGGVLVQLRLICNMLDGMVAIERGTASPVGELYNEIPDRISDMAALIGLGSAASSDVVLGYAAAGLAVFVAYVRAAVRAAGAPSDFRGPMAKQQRMFLVTMAAAFMGFTPMEWQRPFWSDWTVPRAVLAAIVAGCVLTAFTRVLRGARILRALKG